MKEDTRLIFIGNSMVECSVVDDRLSNCQNVAKSAKQYLFALADLREILKFNPQVDTVVLGCSPFTLREFQADNEYYNSVFIESVNYYAPFLKINEYAMLPETLPFLKFDFGIYGLRYLWTPQVPGAYLYNKRQNLQKAIEFEKKKDKELLDKNVRRNAVTLYALQEIKDVCKKYDVTLMFLAPPIWNAKESYDLNEYRTLMHKYLTTDDKKILDFTELSMPDSCYADIIHLNHYGADILTEHLKKRLGR